MLFVLERGYYITLLTLCVTLQTELPIRIVGLAHSMADAKDVGDWIGAPPHALFAFPPSVRPVPMEIHMHGLDIHNFDARMQVSL